LRKALERMSDEAEAQPTRPAASGAVDSTEVTTRVAMTEAIDAEGLIKRFGKVTALDGLDLHVRTGEVHRLSRPNGAGTTTAIRILLGLMRSAAAREPARGDPWGRPPRCTAGGVRAGRRHALANLTGGEVIDLLGGLRGGLDPKRARAARALRARPAQEGPHLLQGQPAKGRAGRRLASDVELLILDEPTSGLDPDWGGGLPRRHLQEKRRGDRTVLLSSHILAEVEGSATG